MNTRNGTADLLKGIAVLFMVQVHLTEVFAVKEFYNSMLGHISLFLGGPPAAPVFMAVMGYFLYCSRKSLMDNIERGFLLIAGGILLNTGLNFHLLYHTFSGQFDNDPYKYILGADILPLAGLSVIIISLMKKYFKQAGSFLLLFVIVLVITPILNDVSIIHPYIQAFLGGNITWSYFPLFPWLSYPLAGYLFAFWMNKGNLQLDTNKIRIIVITLAVIIAATFPLAFPISYDLPRYYHHTYLFTFWTLGFVLLSTLFFYWVEKKAGGFYPIRYIKWVGKNVTSFYVVQWLLIGNIATDIYQTQDLPKLIIWFIVITGATSLIAYLYKKANLSLSNLPTAGAENRE